jgi:WD40 repeat protein
LLLDIAPQNARSVAFSPCGSAPEAEAGRCDGGSVLVGPGKGLSQTPDYSLILVDAGSGEEIRRFSGHKEAVADLAFSADYRQVLSASLSGELFLWDVVSGTQLRAYPGHGSGILAATFSPDASLIASAGQAGDIFIWDAAGGYALRHLRGHRRQVLALAFHPNGQTLLSAADDDTVREWRIDLDEADLQDWIAANRYVMELTDEQRVQYNIAH